MTRMTPANRVVELRVHGVNGTPPEAMLDDPNPRWIAGNTMGRIYRKQAAIAVHGYRPRIVEGYHWGRYTAGSASRALWLLLLPFALLNLAHFALLSPPSSKKGRRAEQILRLLGLTLTLALVVTTCYVAWEIVARQCDPNGCSGAPDSAKHFKNLDLSFRILIAAIAPAAVIVLLWVFGRRPPDFAPPGGLEPPQRDEAGPDKDRLGNATFWLGANTAPRQRAAHVAAACAVTSVLALATVGGWQTWAPAMSSVFGTAYVALLVASGVAGAAALAVVFIDRQPRGASAAADQHWWTAGWLLAWLFASNELRPDRWQRDSIRIPGWLSVLRWGAAVTALGSVIFASAVARRSEPADTAGSVVFENAVALIGLLAGVLLAALLLLCWLMSWDDYGRQVRHGAPLTEPPTVPKAFRPYYRGLGAVVLAATAVTVAFGFSTATVWWTARLLGTPGRPGDQPGSRVEVATGYWTSAAVWGGITAVLIVTAFPLVAWMMRRIPPLLLLLVVAVDLTAATGVAALNGGARIASAVFLGLVILVSGLRMPPAGTFAVPIPMPGRRRPKRDPEAGNYMRQVREDYTAAEVQELGSVARVARSWRVAMVKYRYHHALGAVAAVGGLASVIWAGLCVVAWVQRQPPEAGDSVMADAMVTASVWTRANANHLIDALTTLGVTSATVLAAALVWLGISTWRKPKIRTLTGILWDILSFWPRVAHPLCPLPYGGRAVRAVAKRTSELLDQRLDVDGQDVRDDTGSTRDFDAVVLSGHSQGSVITLAACAVIRRCQETNGLLTPEQAKRAWSHVRLVTYGSQLQFIYARMFPSYLGFQVQKDLYHDLGGRWRNLYRWTDPLGGPVLSWPTTDDAGPDKRFGPTVRSWTTMGCPDRTPCQQQREVTGSTRPGYLRWAYGPDIRLRDPGVIEESPFAPRVSAQGHGNYIADPGFDLVVAELGADATAEASCGGNHARPEAEQGTASQAASAGALEEAGSGL